MSGFCGAAGGPVFADGNFSRCFAVSLDAFVPAGFALIAAAAALLPERRRRPRYAWVPLEPLQTRRTSDNKPATPLDRPHDGVLWTIRMATWLLLAMPLLELVMLVKELSAAPYQIMGLIMPAVAWACSLVIISIELRRYRRFTIVLPVFWFVSLASGAALLYYHAKFVATVGLDATPVEQKVALGVYGARYGLVLVLNVINLFLTLRMLRPGAYLPLPGSESVQDDGEPQDNGERQADGATATTPAQPSPWVDMYNKMRKLLPFVWPSSDRRLQVYAISAFALLLGMRVINVYVPVFQKIIVDALAGKSGEVVFPLQDILIYVFLRFLQGGTAGLGLLSNWRSLLWIRVEQYTTREISVNTFSHLHKLSLRYHLQRKTGEVLRVIDRGTASITTLLSAILFNIVPTILDIGIAIVYFVVAFDIYFGIIVFLSMVGYMAVTVWITEWRTKFRREMIDSDNDARQKSVDSLLNFETVKYFGADAFEVSRYRNAILVYNEADWKSQSSLVLLNSVQNVIITAGLLAGMMLSAWQVYKGILTVGDFTLFLSYIIQLYGPLNWFGTYYRTIQQNFVDMEKMLDLLKQNIEIQDDPDAPDLIVAQGEVEFDDVSFRYDERVPAIRNISFKVPPGHTVALVGASGGGKSTIMRLLFRFYDVNSGRILIDGQDIRHVTQQSLRRSIGVVPQDTVLFNDTIKYNIAYGNVEVMDEARVIEAATRAQIHDKILGFPDGYQTMVGERGLRLSGGEKQRVAIARTLVKNPRIVLLDEATSALDTETERHIQASLAEMSQNRTTLVIAHRLSTIINANTILVLKAGEIVERGTHAELLERQGEYHKLWTQQLESHHDKAKSPPPPPPPAANV